MIRSLHREEDPSTAGCRKSVAVSAPARTPQAEPAAAAGPLQSKPAALATPPQVEAVTALARPAVVGTGAAATGSCPSDDRTAERQSRASARRLERTATQGPASPPSPRRCCRHQPCPT